MFETAKTHTHTRVQGQPIEINAFGLPLQELYEKNVVCLTSNDTVFDAAKLMQEHHIGNIVVTEESRDGESVPVGIITDRDIVINSVAKKLAPDSVKLADVMTKTMVTATENASLTDIIRMMTDEGVSRLPIVDSLGQLKGILTSKRLFQYFAQGLCELSSLSNQQQGREQKTH